MKNNDSEIKIVDNIQNENLVSYSSSSSLPSNNQEILSNVQYLNIKNENNNNLNQNNYQNVRIENIIKLQRIWKKRKKILKWKNLGFNFFFLLFNFLS